jgi:hypothetical protein
MLGADKAQSSVPNILIVSITGVTLQFILVDTTTKLGTRFITEKLYGANLNLSQQLLIRDKGRCSGLLFSVTWERYIYRPILSLTLH